MTEAKTQPSGAGLRVIHLDSGREMRGGQWQALALHKGLIERGIDSVLLAKVGARLEAAAHAMNVPVEPLGLGRIWAERRRAVIHAHDAGSHTLAALVAPPALVVSRRVAFPVKRGVLSRWKYGRAALYLAVSRQVRAELLRAGISEERIRVVYDGVSPLPPPVERRDVVALESADPGKCGGLIREAAAAGNFRVAFSTNLPEAFRSARLFVYLSLSEGLGSAALLAMSAGIPVIASNLPALAEVVENGKTGLLVDNEATAVARAVETLLGDAALCTSMGEAGRAAVQARFGIDRMVNQTLAAYESL